MKHSPSLSSGLPHFALLWLITAALVLLSAPGMVGALRGLSDAGSPATRAVLRLPSLPSLVAPPFVAPEGVADRDRATQCLAQAIYYEAGFEPEAGQRAVAQVVLNRVRDRNFPHTVCGVVYQGVGRKTGCQFSFVCDGSLQRRPPQPPQWDTARKLAAEALDGYVVSQVGTATHYHTDYVTPWWKPTLVQVSQIGQHIFYRWPGRAGLPAALTNRYAGNEVSVWERFTHRPARGRGHGVRRA